MLLLQMNCLSERWHKTLSPDSTEAFSQEKQTWDDESATLAKTATRAHKTPSCISKITFLVYAQEKINVIQLKISISYACIHITWRSRMGFSSLGTSSWQQWELLQTGTFKSGWRSIKLQFRASELHNHHSLFYSTAMSCYFLSKPH